MNQSTALTMAIDQSLARIARQLPGPARLEAQLRQLVKWRAIVLSNTLVAKTGDSVTTGPFKGTANPVAASEGSRAPRLLGIYGASLHPVIEAVISRAYAQVIDIGCAEGYDAVGLARRMPGAVVPARDTDPRASALCAVLDRLLLLWEWRASPTPWLWMERR